MTVLVGYASAHGSTRGIAERLAERLSELGCPADAMPLDSDADPEAYAAVVLGSAVQSQRWLLAAEDFVRAHRDALAERPLWAFSVGIPAALRGPWCRFAGGGGGHPRRARTTAQPAGSLPPLWRHRTRAHRQDRGIDVPPARRPLR
nr:flavodoxin domain-containing protein [Streptacidiphilus anmyonensis]